MIALIGKLIRNAKGATAVEYGLILALVVLAMMAALVAFAHASNAIWGNVSDKVVAAGS